MKTRMPAVLHAAVAAGLTLGCCGCSFAFSRGPSARPEVQGRYSVEKCSTSIAPPVLDTVFTGTHFLGGVAALTLPDSAFGGSKSVRQISAGADLTLAGIYLVSMVYGYTQANACRDFKAGQGEETAADFGDGAAR